MLFGRTAMYERQQRLIQRQRMIEEMWYRYTRVLLNRCFQLRIASSKMSEDLFIKI